MATTREEYKNKIEEIQDMMDSGEVEEALSELDDMNFRKVHNINTLLEASKLYEKAGKYDDAFEVLLVAYDRSPAGRLIIYRLALLSIKMGNLDEAKEYYDRFVNIAPHDNLKYEIRYEIAKAAEAGGADGVSLINTLLGMKIDINTRRPILANNMGGLSGPAVKPVAIRMVHQVYNAVNIPIIGMGGVMSGADVIEFMLAGAKLVALGTGMFRKPDLILDVKRDIEAYMSRFKIEDINDIIGQVQLN